MCVGTGFFVLYIAVSPVGLHRVMHPFDFAPLGPASEEVTSESPSRRLLSTPYSASAPHLPRHYAPRAPKTLARNPKPSPPQLASSGSPSGLQAPTWHDPRGAQLQLPSPGPRGQPQGRLQGVHSLKNPTKTDARSLLGYFRESGYHLWGKWAGRGSLATLEASGVPPRAVPTDHGDLHAEGSRGLAADTAGGRGTVGPKERPQQDVRAGDPDLSAAQRGVRMAFFVWLSVGPCPEESVHCCRTFRPFFVSAFSHLSPCFSAVHGSVPACI